ncbi:MAG TPA: hypothetical protein VK760_15305 [Candidatus Acidoferrales bacterium]|nr:hypothetical protein [Candidatus Acidoferrales bacterium]
MNLRLKLAGSVAVLLLAGCRGASGANAVPASFTAVQAAKGQAQVLLTLPVIIPARPAPVAGLAATRLSSATQLVAGTFGSAGVGPIALTRLTPGCRVLSDGLHCKVKIELPVGTNELHLTTYSSSIIFGAPLARASGTFHIVAGRLNRVTPDNWTGLAATFKLAVSKKNFRQGVPSSTTISFYGIDAAGAIIPSNVVDGPAGSAVEAELRLVGDYPRTITLPENAPFTQTTFTYDGRLAGSTSVRAIPIDANARNAFATSKLRFQPGAVGAGQLFVYGDGDGEGSRLVEWALGVSGNAPPLRTYALSAGPIWADASGDFWAGPFSSGGQSWFEKYDANGAGFVRIASDSGVEIVTGALDRQENVYAAELDTRSYRCYMHVYSAASAWKTQRLFYIGSSCPSKVAADSSGNVYVAAPAGQSVISEYGPTAEGEDAMPIRTFAIPPDPVIGFAVDSTGAIYLQSFATLLRYEPGSSAALQALPGRVIGRFALDPNDNVYISSYGIIYEFAPRTTTAIRTVSIIGSATGLVEGIAVGQ